MSKKYIFEGYSDDTFGEYGISNIDHDDCGSGSIRYFTISKAYLLLGNTTGQACGT